MKKILAVISAALLIAALNPGQALAATLVVNDDAAGNAAEPAPCDVAPDHTDIQSAVDAAAPGDTISSVPVPMRRTSLSTRTAFSWWVSTRTPP